MTVIAAVRTDKGVWLGGDSAVSDFEEITVAADPKVWVRKVGEEKLLMGAAGSYRFSQIVQYQMEMPEPPRKQNPTEWMNTDFSRALGDAVRGTRHQVIEDSIVLVVYRHRIYEVFPDQSAMEHCLSYAAVGCGGPYSLGAFAASETLHLNPKQRLLLAMKAAGTHSTAVQGPYKILFQERGDW